MPQTPISTAVAVSALVALVSCGTASVLAQGRSDAAPGKSGQKPKSERSRASEVVIGSPTTSAGSTSTPVAAANALVYYGSWLDDASIVQPGDVWVGLASGVWRGDGHRQIDVPVASLAVGMTQRFHVGGSASFYHFRDADGLTENGFGNISAYGKFQIVTPRPANRAFGLAITPLVEFVPGSGDQTGWALPVNLELRQGRGRIYGSAGYFSRGSIFATAAGEIPLSSRTSLTGTFGQSYARAGTHQTSVGVGIAYFTSANTAVFGGFGQTFMPVEIGPGGLSVAGGLSVLVPQLTARRKP